MFAFVVDFIGQRHGKSALDDLLTAMFAPSVASSQESLIKAWTSFHRAWFVVSDLSMIKDSQIMEGSDWFGVPCESIPEVQEGRE